MFIESGVYYSSERQNYKQQEFRYKLKYLPTGEIFERVVYAEMRETLYKLLNYWNKQPNWKAYF